MRVPARVTIASIADMQFRFNKEGSGFDLTIIGADKSGKDVEVNMTGQMAVGIANGIGIALEQNALRAAAIASGTRNADEPETRVIPEIRSTH